MLTNTVYGRHSELKRFENLYKGLEYLKEYHYYG
jgi:hypothetical protein